MEIKEVKISLEITLVEAKEILCFLNMGLVSLAKEIANTSNGNYDDFTFARFEEKNLDIMLLYYSLSDRFAPEMKINLIERISGILKKTK